ncbi:MAG: ABC transporter permease [Christensenellaceae bacterium]|nr:ABC transporter permease [Christensenellaceae bacterium]
MLPNELENLNLPQDAFEPLESATAAAECESIHSISLNFFRDSWRRLKKNKSAVLSLAVLLLVALLAFGSIWVSPHNPNKQDLAHVNLPPRIPGVSVDGFNGTALVSGERVDKYAQLHIPADVNFYLGTDGLGRDALSRLLMGTRTSLIIAIIAALLDLSIGVAYGMFSAISGGRVDEILQRILEILSGIPTLVVMILMLTIFEPGMVSIILAMIITGWVNMARMVRAQTLKLQEQEFVLAAATLGVSKLKIALKHILPNISSIIVVQMMFSIPTAIFFEAFLSFIGLGLKVPMASLGTLLSDGYKTFRFLPHLMWPPAIVLSIIMICFNLLADGIRDAFDPKMKG